MDPVYKGARTGVMVYRCIEAAKKLSQEGIDCRVINIHTIKPLDISLVRDSAEKTGAIVSVEEHSIMGGLGECPGRGICRNYSCLPGTGGHC